MSDGGVALGGCPPRAPTDPYVDALDHTVPQDMDSLLDVRVDDPRSWEPIALQQPVEPIPGHLALAVAAVSRLDRELGLLNLTKFPRRHSWAKS